MSTGDHMFVARSMLFCGFWWLRGGEVAACSNQNGVCKIVGWCQIATTICSNCSYHAFILITEPLITHFAVALLAQTVKREFWSLWHTFTICIYIIDIWMHTSNIHNMVINQSPTTVNCLLIRTEFVVAILIEKQYARFVCTQIYSTLCPGLNMF